MAVERRTVDRRGLQMRAAVLRWMMADERCKEMVVASEYVDISTAADTMRAFVTSSKAEGNDPGL